MKRSTYINYDEQLLLYNILITLSLSNKERERNIEKIKGTENENLLSYLCDNRQHMCTAYHKKDASAQKFFLEIISK